MADHKRQEINERMKPKRGKKGKRSFSNRLIVARRSPKRPNRKDTKLKAPSRLSIIPPVFSTDTIMMIKASRDKREQTDDMIPFFDWVLLVNRNLFFQGGCRLEE